MTFEEALPLILPLIALQLILIGISLWDLTRADRRVKGGSKWVWALVIVFGQLVGPLVYLFIGREES